jgi:hypothetical protein
MRIRGELPVEVFAATDPTFMLSLPRHGRMQLSSLFPLPNQPDIDIGITGERSRPDIFQVDVDAGPNGAEWRIDIASPDIANPARLQWRNDESVRRCCSEPTWGRKPTSRSGHSSSVPWLVQLSH